MPVVALAASVRVPVGKALAVIVIDPLVALSPTAPAVPFVPPPTFVPNVDDMEPFQILDPDVSVTAPPLPPFEAPPNPLAPLVEMAPKMVPLLPILPSVAVN